MVYNFLCKDEKNTQKISTYVCLKHRCGKKSAIFPYSVSKQKPRDYPPWKCRTFLDRTICRHENGTKHKETLTKFSNYRCLYKSHSCILKFFWSKLPYTFWYMCGYSVISLLVWDKMTPNFRCEFKVHWQSCLQEKVYIILFQYRVNRHVCGVINFMINVILSYLHILVMQ